MKRILVFVLCSLLFAPLWAQPQAGHYVELDGKSGEALFQAVSTCAEQGHSRVSYDGLWTAFRTTDSTPAGKVWDMYSNCDYAWGKEADGGNQCGSGGIGGECDCYNREHSIPKSWWGGHTTPNQYSDLFHLVPTDGNVNTIRNNNPYGEVSEPTRTTGNGSKVGPCSFAGYTGKAFEPIDEYKGDLARGILGTMTHYQGAWTEQDGATVFTGDYTAAGHFGLTEYALNLFLKWHRQDPVSQKELDRNNGIEATQGNRNPFIDYPELVEYIWGNKQGRKLTLSDICLAYDKTCVPTDEVGKDDEDDTGDGGEPSGDYYYRLTTTQSDYSGTYLVVYEKDSVTFNANAESIGAAGNYLPVKIENGIIYATTALDSATVTVAVVDGGYSVATAKEMYLLAGNGRNTIVTSETAYLHEITLDTDANAVIACTTDVARVLRYLSSGSNKYFRYYEDKANTTSKPVQLYRQHKSDEGVQTKVEDVLISVSGNRIIGESATAADLYVFDFTGKLIIHKNNLTTFSCSLSSGFYLVRYGKKVTKIHIGL